MTPTKASPNAAGKLAANPLSAHDERRVAVAAHVDPRTVRNFMRGRTVRNLCEVRLRRALEQLGLPPPAHSA